MVNLRRIFEILLKHKDNSILKANVEALTMDEGITDVEGNVYEITIKGLSNGIPVR